MNLKNYPRKDYAIGQFTQPHCTELEGQNFYFVMDGGYDFELHITGKDTLTWNKVGEEPKCAKYECLKGDDTTYLLDYDVVETLGTDTEYNHLFVIDTEQRLVTMAVCHSGYNPRLPYLVKSEYDFGAIKVDGMELPFKRHCFTSQMVGTRVEWHWNINMWTHHNYYSSAYYTLTWPDDSEAVQNIGGPFESLPSHDDVSQYIKIKDNLFLYCLTEELMERVLNCEGRNGSPFRSNNMLFLQNYERMMHVGRTFGHITMDGKTMPCRTLFGSFGNPIKLKDSVLYAENAYTV